MTDGMTDRCKPVYPPTFSKRGYKKDILGSHFRSDEEVETAVKEWVNGKDPDFFSDLG